MTRRYTRIVSNKTDNFVTSDIAAFSFEAKRCVKYEILLRENCREKINNREFSLRKKRIKLPSVWFQSQLMSNILKCFRVMFKFTNSGSENKFSFRIYDQQEGRAA
jgi:hypothetical protein